MRRLAGAKLAGEKIHRRLRGLLRLRASGRGRAIFGGVWNGLLLLIAKGYGIVLSKRLMLPARPCRKLHRWIGDQSKLQRLVYFTDTCDVLRHHATLQEKHASPVAHFRAVRRTAKSRLLGLDWTEARNSHKKVERCRSNFYRMT